MRSPGEEDAVSSGYAYRSVVTEHGRKWHLALGVGFARTLCGVYHAATVRGAQVSHRECWGANDDDCQRCAATYRKDERECAR